MKRAVTVALLAILGPAVLCSGALAAPDQSLKQAIAAYNKSDYQRCTTLLEGACAAALSRDATAHYYLANSLVKLNRAREARTHYEITAALAPNTALATYANAGLANLNSRPAVAAASSQNNSASATSQRAREAAQLEADKAQQMEEALYPRTIPKDFNPANIDSSFIEIKRRTADTNFVLSQVDAALKIVPKSIKDELKQFGVKVMVTPGILEAAPELVSETPRGYVHGGGYTNTPAMYRGATKTILISERCSYKSSLPFLNRQASAGMLHEMGHALDHCRNDLSDNPIYTKIYAEDLQRLTNTQKNEFPYYTQGDGGGESELFAELFSFAADPRLLSIDYNGNLAKAFPKTFKYITNVIK